MFTYHVLDEPRGLPFCGRRWLRRRDFVVSINTYGVALVEEQPNLASVCPKCMRRLEALGYRADSATIREAAQRSYFPRLPDFGIVERR